MTGIKASDYTDEPTATKFEVIVTRSALGHATYQLTENGLNVGAPIKGGWDDTTPWDAGPYTATMRNYDGNAFALNAGQLAQQDRTGILFHRGTSSFPSQGCLVAPQDFLNNITSQMRDAGVSTLYLDVKDDASAAEKPTISIKATTSAVSNDQYVHLDVSLSKPISKDLYVFIKVKNPDDIKGNEFSWTKEQDSSQKVVTAYGDNGQAQEGVIYHFRQIYRDLHIKGAVATGLINHESTQPQGFWVKIPAETTGTVVDVKPVYNDPLYTAAGEVVARAPRTETFTIDSYGITYGNNVGEYRDGGDNFAKVLIKKSPSLTASVTIKDESHHAYGIGSGFYLKDPYASTSSQNFVPVSSAWTIHVDPTKTHTLTVNQFFDADVTVTAKYFDTSGTAHELKLGTGSRSGANVTYTIDPTKFANFEGELQFTASCPDPHKYDLYIDKAGQSVPPSTGLFNSNVVSGPTTADFVPGGTGAPGTVSSDGQTSTYTDDLGNVIYREIDSSDGTREVMNYLIPDAAYVASDRTYDASGNVQEVTLYNADLSVYASGTAVLNADGTSTVVLYDANGLALGSEIDNPYTVYSLRAIDQTLSVDSSGERAESLFDNIGTLVSRVFLDGNNNVVGTESISSTFGGPTVSTFYDADDVPTRVEVSGILDKPYTKTSTTYRADGSIDTIDQLQLDGTLVAHGVVTYPGNGDLSISYTDASGRHFEDELDRADGTKQVTVYGIEGEPFTKSVTEYPAFGGGFTSQLLYYADGALYQSTSVAPTSKTIETYDETGGLLVREIDGDTKDVSTYQIQDEPYNSSETTYDYQNNVLSQTYFYNDGTKETIANPALTGNGTKTDALYNADGSLSKLSTYSTDGTLLQIEAVSYAGAQTTEQFYDGNSDLVQVNEIAQDGSMVKTTYDRSSGSTVTTISTIDSSGELTEQDIINADGCRTNTTYGIEDQLYSTIVSHFDVSGVETTQDYYDGFGSLVQRAIVSTTSEGTTSAFYDPSGLHIDDVQRRTDGTSEITTYGFDGAEYITDVTDTDATGRTVRDVSYDPEGTVLTVSTTSYQSDGTSTQVIKDQSGATLSTTTTASDGSYEQIEALSDNTFSTSDIHYGADGTAISGQYFNADGSLGQSFSTSISEGDQTTTVLDGVGNIVEVDVLNSDGSGVRTTYSVDAPGESLVETMSASGSIVDDHVHADGSHDVVTYQPDDETYSAMDRHVGADGTLLGISLLDENGSLIASGTTRQNADGSSETEFFTPEDSLVRDEVDFGDGSKTVNRYGITGEDYASSKTSYNAEGTITEIDYRDPFGQPVSSELYAVDGAGDMIESRRDGSNNLIEVDEVFSDGTASAVLYAAGVETSEATYAADGTPTTRKTINADGSHVVTDYRLAGQGYSSIETAFDASGTPGAIRLLGADGSVFMTGTSTRQSDGSEVYSASNSNQSITITRQPDLSREEVVTGITGEPYAKSDTFYDPAGRLISATFENASGNVVMLETASTDADGSTSQNFTDASGNFIKDVETNADGSKSVLTASTAASNELTEDYYTSTGVLVEGDVLRSDGKTATVYGIVGKPYDTTITQYDLYGIATSIERIKADGSVYQTGTPENYVLGQYDSAPDGSVTIDYVDSSGQPASKETSFQDGSSEITTFVSGQPYSSVVARYNADGDIISQTYSDANGAAVSSEQFYYDRDGTLDLTVSRDGSSNVVSSSKYNADGSVETRTFDASGAASVTMLTFSDGSSEQTIIGSTSDSFTQRVTSFAADGSVSEIDTYNKDGTKIVAEEVSAPTSSSYASDVTIYNSSGQETSREYLLADGSVEFDEETSYLQDGSSIQATTNADGQTVEYDVLNADGSSSKTTSGIVGTEYSKIVSEADASGAPTDIKYYDASDALVQDVTYSKDAAGHTLETTTNNSGAVVRVQDDAPDDSYTLTTAEADEPYSSLKQSFDVNGQLTGEVYTRTDGSVFVSDSISYVANADGSTTIVDQSSNGVQTSLAVSASQQPISETRAAQTLSERIDFAGAAAQPVTDVLTDGISGLLATSSIADDGSVTSPTGIVAFGVDDGACSISAATASSLSKIMFGVGQSDQSLWFQKVNDDLVISLLGTSDTLKLSDWYDDPSSWSSVSIEAAGDTLDRASLDGLVSAMAEYAAANASFDPHVYAFMPDDESLQSPIGDAWDGSTPQINTITGTDGNDTIVISESGDYIDLGHGDDQVSNDSGVNGLTYLYASGDGNDQVNFVASSWSTDVVRLTNLKIADVALTRVGQDLHIEDTSTGEVVDVWNQWYDSTNENGIAEIQFADGNVFTRDQITKAAVIVGTEGADSIYDPDSNTTVDLGKGDDTITHNQGETSQTYLYASGDGNDTINAFTPSGSSDTLKFTNLNLAQVELSRTQDNDLVIANKDTGETITVSKQWYDDSGNYGIARLAFADGTILDQAQISTAAWIRGTDGNDSLYAYGSGTTVDGGLGDDFITHGNGETGQTYVYALGDGNDTIGASTPGGSSDVLKLTNIDADQVTLLKTQSKDLLVETLANGQSIDVWNQFASADGENGIAAIQFADGTVWDASKIETASEIIGTSGDDDLSVYGQGTIVDGGLGDDMLSSDDGSTGHTFIYNSGDGSDTIHVHSGTGSTDVLQLLDLNRSDVEFTQTESHDLLITTKSTGQTIDVENQFYDDTGDDGINQITFANGQVFDREDITEAAWFRGTSGNDDYYIYGSNTTADLGLGDDKITHGFGETGQTYVYAAGDGNDTINAYTATGSTDVLKLTDLTRNDVTLSRALDQDLLVTTNANGQTIDVQSQWYDNSRQTGISEIVFANGATLDWDGITQAAVLQGTSEADQVTVSQSNVTVDLGEGDDQINNDAGVNGLTYLYASGDGNDQVNFVTQDLSTDVLSLTDLNRTDVTFTRRNQDLLVQDNTTGEVLDVWNQWYDKSDENGVSAIRFADGTSMGREAITEAATITGTDGNDSIYDPDSNTTVDLGPGDDNIAHNSGETGQTYLYAQGDGNDTIDVFTPSGSTDQLRFTNLDAADLQFTRTQDNQLLVKTLSNGQTIEVKNQWADDSGDYGLESVQFGDGTVWDQAKISANAWMRGTDGDDNIYVNGSGTTLDAGLGDDYISHGNGETGQTYLYARGDGNDTINATTPGGSSDTLKFADLNAGDMTLTHAANGDLLVETLSNSQTIDVLNQFYDASGRYGIADLSFADGTLWGAAQIAEAAWYRAGSGDTTVSADAGNATLAAGSGNDTLIGGAGNDTFVYGSGDGNLTIQDNAASSDPARSNTLSFTNLNANDMTFHQTGKDLLIDVSSTGRSISVTGEFNSVDHDGVQQIGFADGTSWNRTQIQSNIAP